MRRGWLPAVHETVGRVDLQQQCQKAAAGPCRVTAGLARASRPSMYAGSHQSCTGSEASASTSVVHCRWRSLMDIM